MSDQPMTPAELAECAEVAGKATPGPWISARGGEIDYYRIAKTGPYSQKDIIAPNGACIDGQKWQANYEFIARSREWVPRLLATVAARDAEIERLKKTRDMCREAIQDADLCTGCGREQGFEHYCRGGLGLYD